MKTLREELEDVIVTIQLRRGNAKTAVDHLLQTRGAEPEAEATPAQSAPMPDEEDATAAPTSQGRYRDTVAALARSAQDGGTSDTRFKNQPSEEFMVSAPFKAGGEEFAKGHECCARMGDEDNVVELENRDTGKRVALGVDEFDGVLGSLEQKRSEEFDF